MLIRKALPIDYPGIVALQRENRPENLTDEQKRQGFVLKRLFQAAKALAAENYDTGAAFINVSNPHSLAAHVSGLGMTALTPFSHDGQNYDIVVFATRGS